MDDLISRKKLFENEIPYIHEHYTGVSEKPYDAMPVYSMQQIERQPCVDAVEVVRCRDCKYASMTSGGECKYCKQWETEEALYLDGNFFCAWGERREKNEAD